MTTATKTIKPRGAATAAICGIVAAWLSENIYSHNIYDSRGLWGRFTEALKPSGFTFPADALPIWPEHSPEETLKAIKARGLGGSLAVDAGLYCANGWDIAEAIADYFTTWEGSSFMGRGFRCRAACEAVQQAAESEEAANA